MLLKEADPRPGDELSGLRTIRERQPSSRSTSSPYWRSKPDYDSWLNTKHRKPSLPLPLFHHFSTRNFQLSSFPLSLFSRSQNETNLSRFVLIIYFLKSTLLHTSRFVSSLSSKYREKIIKHRMGKPGSSAILT